MAVTHVKVIECDLSDLDNDINAKPNTVDGWFALQGPLSEGILDRVINRNYPKRPVWRYLVTKHAFPYNRTAFERYVDVQKMKMEKKA